MKKFLPRLLYFLLSVAFIYTTPLQALENSATNKSTVINAKVIKRHKSRYPRKAAKNNQEGWVVINFVIDKEGRVIDPFIQDSSGISSFEKDAINAIKKWEYIPASKNGQPIEQSNRTVKFDYKFNGIIDVSGKFHRRYTSLVKSIKKNDLATAKNKLDKLYNNQFWNYTESSFYWLADATYAQAIQDDKRELISVNKALAVDNAQINETNISYLLFRQFILNLTDTYYFAAVESFKKLNEKSKDKKVISQLQPHFNKVIALIESDEPLVRHAVLTNQGRLIHKLSRSHFSISISEGDLSQVEIRCDNKRSKYEYKIDSVWKIPEAWGECEVILSGNKNSTISIVELKSTEGFT